MMEQIEHLEIKRQGTCQWSTVVEKTVSLLVRITGIVRSLEVIRDNIELLGMPPEEQRQLLECCQRYLLAFRNFELMGSGAHEIRAMILAGLRRLEELNGPEAAEKIAKAELLGWNKEIGILRRHARDVANYIFYRKKLRDREKVEESAKSHPLIKSWEGWSPEMAVRRISEAMMGKYFNHQANHLEVLLGITEIETYPSRMTIEPTSECNFRCTMCPHGHYDLRPTYSEIDDETIERTLPALEFVEHLATQVTGEPTLSLQLGKITNFATSHGVFVEMITNGSLLHKTNADISKIAIVCISFDGAAPEVFEAQRVGARFENVVENVRRVREQNPVGEIEFNVCVTRLNLDQLPDIATIAADLGVDRVRLNPLNTREYPHLSGLELGTKDQCQFWAMVEEANKRAAGTNLRIINHINDRHFERQIDQKDKTTTELIAELNSMDTENGRATGHEAVHRLINWSLSPIPSFINLQRLPVMDDGVSKPQGLISRSTVEGRYNALLAQAKAHIGDKVKLPYCAAPWKGGIFFSNGDYTPCCFMTTNASFGSICQGPFEELWNGLGLQEFRRSMFEIENQVPTCKACNGSQRYTFVAELLKVIRRLGYEWEAIEFPDNFNPPPAVRSQIEACRKDLFERPGMSYRLGTRLDFSEAGDTGSFKRYGFGVSGRGGVWVEDFEAELEFELDAPVGENLLLEVGMMPFLHGSLLPQQRVDVLFNGEHLAGWLYDRPGVSVRSALIEANAVKDGKLRFTFRVPDGITRYHLGLDRGKATRSVMFVSACLSKASGGVMEPISGKAIDAWQGGIELASKQNPSTVA